MFIRLAATNGGIILISQKAVRYYSAPFNFQRIIGVSFGVFRDALWSSTDSPSCAGTGRG
jgi:hypothetical protein